MNRRIDFDFVRRIAGVSAGVIVQTVVSAI